jgi:hypothetical protein
MAEDDRRQRRDLERADRSLAESDVRKHIQVMEVSPPVATPPPTPPAPTPGTNAQAAPAQAPPPSDYDG